VISGDLTPSVSPSSGASPAPFLSEKEVFS